MEREDVKAILADLKQRLQTEFGSDMSRLLVYGSVARGENTRDSDIDVMVVFREKGDMDERWQRAMDISVDVDLEYDTLISILVTSEQELVSRMVPLFMNIRREGMTL